MTRKQQRTTLIISGLVFLGIAAGLILYALRDTIVFFYTPAEVAEKHVQPGTRMRLGGLVEEGSYKKGEDGVVHFAITDEGPYLPLAGVSKPAVMEITEKTSLVNSLYRPETH